MVANFGVGIIPDSLKTPELLHVISDSKTKIQSIQEYQARLHQSPITPDRVYDIVLAITGNREDADRAEANFILEESRRNRNATSGIS